MFQAASDFFSLCGGKEFRSRRVVMHGEKCNNGCDFNDQLSIADSSRCPKNPTNNQSHNTLNNENPRPASSAADAVHFDDSSSQEAAKGSGSGSG